MNFKRYRIVWVSIVLLVLLVGCTGKENQERRENIDLNKSRVITDLGGNEVKIPGASQISRVAIVSPPLLSIYCAIQNDTDLIKGIHPIAFIQANPKILDIMVPGWGNINTSFVGNNFVTNSEELMKINPDIVFYYGESQKKGLENINIPVVDFMKIGKKDNKDTTLAWNDLMEDIFDIKNSGNLRDEWDESINKSQESIKKIKSEKLRALMIFNNKGKNIVVSGKDTYGDDWMFNSGLDNVAKEINGEMEASMEQINQWNPEVIFIFMGEPAQNYIDNEIQSQDWSNIKAWKNQKIYDIPKSISSWGAPCSDSPLMPLWAIHKSYPYVLSETELKDYIKNYYKRMYDLEVDNHILNSIMEPNKK